MKSSDKFKFYKGRYIIVFYDKEDNDLLYVFNNVKEILQFQKKEVNKQNLNIMNINLYNALNRDDNTCNFLIKGIPMRVYIVDLKEE